MSAFLKAQTDWHIGANLPEGVVSSSLYLVRQHGEVVATLVLRHELNAYLRSLSGTSDTACIRHIAGRESPKRC